MDCAPQYVHSSNLDDAMYYFQFDIPRLRELILSTDPSIQAMAAAEVKKGKEKRGKEAEGISSSGSKLISVFLDADCDSDFNE